MCHRVTTAHGFAIADDDVQALAHITEVEYRSAQKNKDEGRSRQHGASPFVPASPSASAFHHDEHIPTSPTFRSSAHITDAEEADPTIAPDDLPNHLLRLILRQIHHCCGTVNSNKFSHIDGSSKHEDNLVNVIAQQKKQAKLTGFFRVK